MILEAEAEDGNIKYGVLDSSLWHKRGDTGPSLAEQMIMKGCRFRPSDRSRGSRVSGKNEIHRRLQVDEYTEEPRMVFFNSCTNIVSQLPSIPLDNTPYFILPSSASASSIMSAKSVANTFDTYNSLYTTSCSDGLTANQTTAE